MAFEDILGQAPPSPWQYAAEYGISEDEVPHAIKVAWRQWNQKERDIANNFIDQGYSPEELGIHNVKEHGQSLWRELNQGGGVEERHKAAFERAVGAGHFTRDDVTGLFYNRGRRNAWDVEAWDWVDASGKKASAPMSRKGGFNDLIQQQVDWDKNNRVGNGPGSFRPGASMPMEPQGPTAADKSGWLQGDPGYFAQEEPQDMQGVLQNQLMDRASEGDALKAGTIGGDIAAPSRPPKANTSSTTTSLFGGNGILGLASRRRAGKSSSLFG